MTSGVTVNVQGLVNIPFIALNEIKAPVGSEISIGIDSTLVSTTDEAKRRFSPDDRQCYFDDEIHLPLMDRAFSLGPIGNLFEGGKIRYDMTSCLTEAVLQAIIEKCQCLPAMMMLLNYHLYRQGSCLQ